MTEEEKKARCEGDGHTYDEGNCLDGSAIIVYENDTVVTPDTPDSSPRDTTTDTQTAPRHSSDVPCDQERGGRSAVAVETRSISSPQLSGAAPTRIGNSAVTRNQAPNTGRDTAPRSTQSNPSSRQDGSTRDSSDSSASPDSSHSTSSSDPCDESIEQSDYDIVEELNRNKCEEHQGTYDAESDCCEGSDLGDDSRGSKHNGKCVGFELSTCFFNGSWHPEDECVKFTADEYCDGKERDQTDPYHQDEYEFCIEDYFHHTYDSATSGDPWNRTEANDYPDRIHSAIQRNQEFGSRRDSK